MWPGLIPSLLGMFQGQQASSSAVNSGVDPGGAAMGAKTVNPPQKVSLQNDSPDTAIQELAQTQAKVNPEAKVQPEEFSNADGTTSMEIRNPDGSYSPAPQEVSPVNPTAAQAGKQSIWDKLSGGIKKFDEGYTQRLQDRGYMEKPGSAPPGLGADKPWSVQSIGDDQWTDRKGGILFNPEDPELRKKMIAAATDEQGNLDASRYKMIQEYQNQTKDNPVYQQKRDEHYKGFGAGIFPGFDRAIGKFFGVQDDKIDLRGN